MKRKEQQHPLFAEVERRLKAHELAAKYKRKGGWRCTGEICSALTQKGERCTLWAYPDGFCPTHSLAREQETKRKAGE